MLQVTQHTAANGRGSRDKNSGNRSGGPDLPLRRKGVIGPPWSTRDNEMVCGAGHNARHTPMIPHPVTGREFKLLQLIELPFMFLRYSVQVIVAIHPVPARESNLNWRSVFGCDFCRISRHHGLPLQVIRNTGGIATMLDVVYYELVVACMQRPRSLTSSK